MLRSLRAVLAFTLALAACSRAPEPPPAKAVPPAPAPARVDRKAWPTGPLRAARATIPFGLRLVGGKKPAEAAALVRKLAARHLPGVPIFDLEKGRPPAPPALGIAAAPPDPLRPEDLRYFARGFDAAARSSVAKPWPTTAVVLFVEGGEADAALKRLTALVAEAARSLGAAVDDPEARLYYSAREFARAVVRDGFEGELPVVTRHVAIHSYEREDRTIRSITVGMSKLGLPDVVVNGHGQRGGAAMQSLVGAVAQTLLERGRVEASGLLDVDLRALRARGVREPLLASLKKGAAARATLTIAEGKLERGDARNRLVELTFEGKPGGATERQEAVVSEVFGAEDPATRGSR